MKKVFIAVAVLGTIGLASCKKDYTCSVTYNGVTSFVEYNDLDKDQAEEQETDCENAGGTWAEK